MATRALNFSIGTGSIVITGDVDTAVKTLLYMDVAYTDLVSASVNTAVSSTSKTEAFLDADDPVTIDLQGITFRSITSVAATTGVATAAATTNGPVGGPRPPGAG